MADKKISALTSAATPLAGTEVLPIVQSGSTVKATVANIVGAGTSPGSFTTGTFSGNVTMGAAPPGNWDAAFGVVQVSTGYGGNSVGSLSGLTNDLHLAGNAYYRSGLGWHSIANKPATLISSDNTSTGNINFLTAPAAGTNAALSLTNRITIGSTTGDLTLSTGNLIIGTSGKGIDFSITSHPAGMTSELLADYEEGTWTPTLTPATSGTITLGSPNLCAYTKIGRVVTVNGIIDTDSVSAPVGTSVTFNNLPFTSNATGTQRSAGTAVGFALTSGTVSSTCVIVSSATSFVAQINASLFQAGSQVYFQLSYVV